MLMCEEKFREAMVGTISLYDAQGERQQTTYIAARPEYGPETFFRRINREVEHIIKLFPDADRQGLVDGAPENWKFLEPLTDTQVLDFQHAIKYLKNVAQALHPRSPKKRKAWLDKHCHQLKHQEEKAVKQLEKMEAQLQSH